MEPEETATLLGHSFNSVDCRGETSSNNRKTLIEQIRRYGMRYSLIYLIAGSTKHTHSYWNVQYRVVAVFIAEVILKNPQEESIGKSAGRETAHKRR